VQVEDITMCIENDWTMGRWEGKSKGE
jgi:hypothetical protein